QGTLPALTTDPQPRLSAVDRRLGLAILAAVHVRRAMVADDVELDQHSCLLEKQKELARSTTWSLLSIRFRPAPALAATASARAWAALGRSSGPHRPTAPQSHSGCRQWPCR